MQTQITAEPCGFRAPASTYQGRLPDLSPAGDFQPFRLHIGPMASGSQVIEDPTIWSTIGQSVRTVLALEMEAVAQDRDAAAVPHRPEPLEDARRRQLGRLPVPGDSGGSGPCEAGGDTRLTGGSD